MAKRISALEAVYEVGRFGAHLDKPQVEFQLHRDSSIIQVAAWPNTWRDVLEKLEIDPDLANQAVGNAQSAALRVEPLKLWLINWQAVELSSELAHSLDLSHSRTRLSISGPRAASLLNRFIPIDLRESQFPVNAIASSAMHHVGVTLWRTDSSYQLFIPRGFAQSIYELLFESALQFGVQVK